MYKPKDNEYFWHIESNILKQLIPVKDLYKKDEAFEYYWNELFKQGNMFKTKKDAVNFIKTLKK